LGLTPSLSFHKMEQMPTRKTKKPIVRLLECPLSKRDVNRSQSQFMQEMFNNLPAEFDSVPVESCAEFVDAIENARKEPELDGLHIVCHGDFTEDGEYLLKIGKEEMPIRRNLNLFKNLGTRFLFMSACGGGMDVMLSRDLLRIARIESLWSYGREITDAQAFAIETLFYTCLYHRARKWTMEEIHRRLCFGLEYLKIDNDKDAIVEPILTLDCLNDLRFDLTVPEKTA